jgi:sulfur carrier protein ThiS
MSEKIIKRAGSLSQREKATKNLVEFNLLKAEYNSHKGKIGQLESNCDVENVKLQRLLDQLNKYRDELAISQEAVDADPLPEGAQPKERIQRRDRLRLVSLFFDTVTFYLTRYFIESFRTGNCGESSRG